MTVEKHYKLRVYSDKSSPTGYSIVSGTYPGVAATLLEIHLWQMYLQALDLACRLRVELKTAAEESRSHAAGK